MTSKLIASLDRRWYPNTKGHWDDKLFRAKILDEMTTENTVLDIGAGAGIVKEMNFRGMCAKIYGVDLDQRILENPYLDDAKVADVGELPYADDMFDLVVADNVMEHLNEPEKVLIEINRVLKPGGQLMFKTPNKWHYMPLIARSTPHWFHEWFNKKRGRIAEDTFPTVYKLNSGRDAKRIAGVTGFSVQEIVLREDRPEYMRLSAITYFLGMIYERLVTNIPLLSGFRISLIVRLMKEK